MASQSNRESSSFFFTQVTFEVEGTLFRVPRHYFEQESDVFYDMFSLPPGEGMTPDGLTNDQPLRLEGIKEADFTQLLRVMFPERLLTTDTFTVSQWISVLKLSTMWQMSGLTSSVLEKLSASAATREDWMTLLDSSVLNQFPDIRDLAIEKLSLILSQQQSGTEKVLLGRKYHVSDWLRTGLRELLKQDAPWSEEYEAILGWSTVSKLYRVREAHYKQKLLQLNSQLQRYRRNDVFHPLTQNQSVFQAMDDEFASVNIGREFGAELDLMDE